ncbi:MAG: flagellar biosynthesis anti-sigma factor FlgM [Gammaproteobacteria bacterium]|nr:flagellar biosynthesis anti-sigma factor FlgM [Gammaproteobacteria bacterium]
MPINISNITPPTAKPTAGASENSKANEPINSHAAKAEQSPKATQEQDSVNLTHSAMQVKSLEEQVARLPIVDTQKVESIRNSISEGSFEFNSDRIAEKLINFEKSLA